MEKCLAIANEKNKKTVWLGVWESNKRAIEFYTRWGFEKFSDHIFPLGMIPKGLANEKITHRPVNLCLSAFGLKSKFDNP
jgi:hypothetical protein